MIPFLFEQFMSQLCPFPFLIDVLQLLESVQSEM